MENRWWAADSWVRQVARSERLSNWLPPGLISLAAIGTLANARLADGPLLATFKEGGLDVNEVRTFQSPIEMVADPEWQLAVVLSPFKRKIVRYCDALSERTLLTGAADTLVRDNRQIIGYNVNSYAIQQALVDLQMLRNSDNVVILGSGGVAASTLAAIASIGVETNVGVLARSRERGVDLISRMKIGRIIESAKDFGATLVINATTVGECDDCDVLEMELGDIFHPGVRLLDANNRLSGLQRLAIESGALVLGGSYLRQVNNVLRVALVSGRGE